MSKHPHLFTNKNIHPSLRYSEDDIAVEASGSKRKADGDGAKSSKQQKTGDDDEDDDEEEEDEEDEEEEDDE